MKQDTHPEYKEVVFQDMMSGKKFLCRSAINSTETTDFEGQTFPCVKISISSDSHPFYTGDQTLVDTEGRVDRFKKRYAKAPQPKKVEAAESKDDKKEDKKKPAVKKAASSKTEETKKVEAKKAPESKDSPKKAASPEKKASSEKKNEKK